MSDDNTITIKDLEKSKKGRPKAGSTATANAFHTPDRYKTEE
jgi:hypothetical protein